MATNLTAIISADTAGFVKNVRQARQQLVDWANEAKDQSKDVKKATAEQVNAYIRVLDQMKKTTDGTKDTTTVTKQLTKEIQELKIQYANLSDEAKSGDFGQSMRQQIEQASAQLNKMNTQIQQTSTQMKNLGQGKSGGLSSMQDQFKGLVDIMDDFGVKGAGSISTVMSNMEGLGSTASKLGPLLTNPYVAAAAAIASAGVALADYDMKLQASLKKTSKMTGESGEALHQLRAGVQSLVDVYGSDYDDQLEATNTLMQQFAITGREAVDAISFGLSKGVSDVDAYLNNVKELSGSFADAGLSANDFTNMLTKINQGLISEDSFKIMQNGFKNISKMESGLVSALSAIGIDSAKLQEDINSGAITTAQALNQITTAIGQFPPASAEAQNAIRTCFEEEGQRAGYAMVTALGDVVTATEDTTDATSEYTNAIRQCQRADEELERVCDEVFSTGINWKALGATIQAGCYSILVDLVKILGGCKDAIVIFCRTGYAWVVRLTNAITDTVDALTSLLSLDWSSFMSKLKKAGQELYNMGTDYGKVMVETIEGGSKNKVNKQIKQQIESISRRLEQAYRQDKISAAQYNKGMADIKRATNAVNQSTIKGDNTARSYISKANSVLSSINKKVNEPARQKPSVSVKTGKARTNVGYKADNESNTADARKQEKFHSDELKALKTAAEVVNGYIAFRDDTEITGNSNWALSQSMAKVLDRMRQQGIKDDVYDDFKKLYDSRDELKLPEGTMSWSIDSKDLPNWTKDSGFLYSSPNTAVLSSIQGEKSPSSIYDRNPIGPLVTQNDELISKIEFQTDAINKIEAYVEKLKDYLNKLEDAKAEVALQYNEQWQSGFAPSDDLANMAKTIDDMMSEAKQNIDSIEGGLAYTRLNRESTVYTQQRTQDKINKYKQEQQNVEDKVRMYDDLGSAVDNVGSSFGQMADAAGLAGDKAVEQIQKIISSISTLLSSIGQIEQMFNQMNNLQQANVAVTEQQAMANQVEANTAAGKAAANAAATGAQAPWPIAAAMILTLVGTVMSALAGFAGGGIIGGKTTVGDMNLARVNKGEMILNGRQQAHLFQVLDSGMTGSSVSVAGGSVKIKGSDLYVALKNYSKSSPNAKTL